MRYAQVRSGCIDSAELSVISHVQFGHIQLGKGWRLDFLASKMRSGTRERRHNSCSETCSTASKSSSYQAGGICLVISSRERSLICFSRRSSQGTNDFIPVTASYTRLRAYSPRSGASGKFHSPALKQKPWSIISVLYGVAVFSPAEESAVG